MSIQAIGWLLEHSKARLADRCVLLSFANHTDRDGRNAWPSVRTVAHEAGVSARQVQRSIRHLLKMKELRIQTAGGGPRGTNVYSMPGVSRTGTTLLSEVTESDKSAPPVGQVSGESGEELPPDRLSPPDNLSPRQVCGAGVTNLAATEPNLSPEPSINRPKNRPQKSASPSPKAKPTLAFEGQRLKITTAEDSCFGTAFPWVNRLSEYRRMDAWVVSNGHSFRRFGRFANNWLAKIKSPAEAGNNERKSIRQLEEDRAVEQLHELARRASLTGRPENGGLPPGKTH